VSLEDRLASLEARLRVAEDKLEIMGLLNSYGPLVDSGEAEAAARLWVAGGAYEVGGGARLEAPDELVAMYRSEGHMGLVNTGVSHLTATPRIEVNGDQASAVAYSFVVLKEGERWFIWRGAINEWKLVRTGEGWRIAERRNRVLDGSKDSHDLMRGIMT
jgi:hypothetical protein